MKYNLNYHRKLHPAFTLAETLITLGIIGIVAALTLPALVRTYKKQQTVTHLQKVYTTLNQALKLSEAKHGPYEYWESGYDMDIIKYYEKYWYPHFKIIKICNTYAECGYKSNQPWKYIDGRDNGASLALTTLRIPFITSDGTLISISIAAFDATANATVASNLIIIDLNGSKNPNTKGIDMFRMVRIKGKGIMPDGYNDTEENIDNNCKTNGDYCFAKIVKDGWKIKNDYSWK